MGYNIQIANEYVAVLLIEILFEKGLVNRQTYINAKKRLTHINAARNSDIHFLIFCVFI